MNEEKCIEQRRFESIEKDIQEIKATISIHAKEISDLKEGQAETRVYVKQIFNRLDELKEMFELFTTTKDNTEDKWLKVALELIKAIGLVAGVVAGIKILK
ncbi:hypothetical protein ABG79_02199 [Caloramator mitchellensis]|uniref:Uncharacterized protein n=1 Tax=Caloramator mitchellensis TaxID=908809 RepID=A0A0R3JRF7_CALMK|nr:hypothetical protein [Caloramator mitchellensis]KRQ86067.1 hypothetical protein ABG79_02199 [Caloramator mitchellensis]